MKYIRTKDGNLETIYELQDNGDWTRKGNLCLDKTHFRYEELQNHIIKQADTIEELCDYWDFFDSIYNEYKTKEICYYTLNDMRAGLEKGYTRDIKLSIRTCKGLIFVAKMNDKGELDLL